jgi:hypothetical protein
MLIEPFIEELEKAFELCLRVRKCHLYMYALAMSLQCERMVSYVTCLRFQKIRNQIKCDPAPQYTEGMHSVTPLTLLHPSQHSLSSYRSMPSHSPP